MIVIRESTNHNHSTALTESGAIVLDDGTFITGKKGDNREATKRKTGLFFFKHISLYWHGEADENCTLKKNEIHKKVVQ